ncbi:hypothetical protein FQR65_LT00559 [Abscondita terminalis]|nr:hypothetical protein FQR65_LT00559 [Abscondita terminalis]
MNPRTIFDKELKGYERNLEIICRCIVSLTVGLICTTYVYDKISSWEQLWLKYVVIQLIILKTSLSLNYLFAWKIFLVYTCIFLTVGAYVVKRVLEDTSIVFSLPWCTSFVPFWFAATFAFEINLFYDVYQLMRLETTRQTFFSNEDCLIKVK